MSNSNDNNMWDWRGEEYCLEDLSNCLMDGVSQNDDMFDDDTTPMKACGDLTYNVTSYDDLRKESVEHMEPSSQVKRRRMLQFDSQVPDMPSCNEVLSSPFLRSKDTFVDESISELNDWVSGFADPPASSIEGLDPPSEGWLADCFNTEMHFCSEDIYVSGTSDSQNEVTDHSNIPPENKAQIVQEHPVHTHQNIIFKGKKSFMRTPAKLASSVVYPFAFIKPCGVHGDVTLKDINQRISTPASNSKQKIEEPPLSYPTSAFSGKPVVGKTKIRTEGGKGCITIMRTKG